jgi:molecular chaperone DnaK (HSP70)
MAAIGIDLGNNFARAAVLRGQYVEQIIVEENGDTKMPCFVAYTSHDERLIGAAARDQVNSCLCCS